MAGSIQGKQFCFGRDPGCLHAACLRPSVHLCRMQRHHPGIWAVLMGWEIQGTGSGHQRIWPCHGWHAVFCADSDEAHPERITAEVMKWLIWMELLLRLAYPVPSAASCRNTDRVWFDRSGFPVARDLQRFLPKLRQKLDYGIASGGLLMKPCYAAGGIFVDLVPQGRYLPIQYTDDQCTAIACTEYAVMEKNCYTRIEIHTYENGSHTVENRPAACWKFRNGHPFWNPLHFQQNSHYLQCFRCRTPTILI